MRDFLQTDISLLQEFLDYDSEAGTVTWKKKPSSRVLVGDNVGTVNSHGYIQFKFRGVCYRLNRVIWALHYGEWPDKLVDHKDGDKLNNRLDNLRLATFQENSLNKKAKKRGSSPFRGVYWNKSEKKWHSQASNNGKQTHLGLFEDELEAAVAYDKFAIVQHGAFAKLNFEGTIHVT